mgnify:CR=1 FL=1
MGGLSSEEAAAVEWAHSMARDNRGKKLFLVAEMWSDETRKFEKTPDAPYVLCLWRMTKANRALLWKELQPQLWFQELGLGGEQFGSSCPVDDEELVILCPEGSLLDLQQLYLRVTDRVTDSGLNALALGGLGAQLTSLTLGDLGREVTDSGLRSLALAGCGVQLTSLSLDGLEDGVTDAGLSALASAGCGALLTSLTLSGLSMKVTDSGLSALASAGCGAQLTFLTLQYMGLKVTDSGLSALASAGCGTQLTSLTLRGLGRRVTDAGLRALASAGCGSLLASLTLSGLKEGVTDAGLSALASAGCGAKLTFLTLSGCGHDVSDHGLSALASAGCGTQLTSLTLEDMKDGVTDSGLSALASAGCGAQLTYFALRRLREGVTDCGLSALASAGCGAQLTSLTFFGLKDGVTDCGLSALASAGCGAQLTSLFLFGLEDGVTDRGLSALASAGCGAKLTTLTLWDLKEGVTDAALSALALVGCGTRLVSISLQGFPAVQRNILPSASDLELFASHICVLASLGDTCLTSASASLKQHLHSSFLPLLHPYFDRDFKATVSRVLPEEVWRGVLGYADPDEYYALTRHAAGVSREFYWLLKNSLTTFRVHRPVVPLCGLVWLHSRDTHFSRIKCVEVGFPAKGVELEGIFRFAGYARRHLIQVTILPGAKRYSEWFCEDRLMADLATLGVEGFILQEQHAL